MKETKLQTKFRGPTEFIILYPMTQPFTTSFILQIHLCVMRTHAGTVLFASQASMVHSVNVQLDSEENGARNVSNDPFAF